LELDRDAADFDAPVPRRNVSSVRDRTPSLLKTRVRLLSSSCGDISSSALMPRSE